MDEIAFQMPESVTRLGVDLLTAVMGLAWNLLAAIAVLVLGFLAAGFATRLVRNTMTRTKFDATLTSFFTNLMYYGLVAMVILAALNNLGIETTQFIAVIGAAGLAVGLALEGALSNFAAGVLIIVFRPFRVGDYIEAADAEGFVVDIEMVVTVLRTLENEIVIIPNSEITGGKIKNLSRQEHISLEIEFLVAHDADLDTVLRILAAAPEGNPHVLAEPAPKVSVMQIERDGVRLQLEVSIPGGAHEDAQYSLVERIKREFDAASIPPPSQRMAMDAPRS